MEFVDTTTVDHTPVRLIDRAGAEPFEFMFDGRPYVKPKGKTEWTLPAFVAARLLTGDRGKVWTIEQEFTFRFGLAEPDEELMGRHRISHAAIDTDPITINHDAIEGWSLDGAEPRTGKGTVVRLQGPALREVKRAMSERLAASERPVFAP